MSRSSTELSKKKIQDEIKLFDVLSSRFISERIMFHRVENSPVEQLLEQDNDGYIGLVYAIMQAKELIIDRYIERAPTSINIVDNFNRSILHHVVTNAGENYKNGKLNLATIQFKYIKILIERGIDIHSEDNFSKTVLMKAVELDNIQIIKAIISAAKEKLKKEQALRNPSLTDAVKKLEEDALLTKLLNTRDKDGVTLLINAVANCSSSVFRYLLSLGADRTGVNKNKRNSLMLAAYYADHSSISAHFSSAINIFHDINAVDSEGNTALYFAVRYIGKNDDRIPKEFRGLDYNKRSIKLLVENGANINMVCSGIKIIDLLDAEPKHKKFKEEIQKLYATVEKKMKHDADLKHQADTAAAAAAGNSSPSSSAAAALGSSIAAGAAVAGALAPAAVRAPVSGSAAANPKSDKEEKTAADCKSDKDEKRAADPVGANSNKLPYSNGAAAASNGAAAGANPSVNSKVDKYKGRDIVDLLTEDEDEAKAKEMSLLAYYSKKAVDERAAARSSSSATDMIDDSPIQYETSARSPHTPAYQATTPPLSSANSSGAAAAIPPTPKKDSILVSPAVHLNTSAYPLQSPSSVGPSQSPIVGRVSPETAPLTAARAADSSLSAAAAATGPNTSATSSPSPYHLMPPPQLNKGRLLSFSGASANAISSPRAAVAIAGTENHKRKATDAVVESSESSKPQSIGEVRKELEQNTAKRIVMLDQFSKQEVALKNALEKQKGVTQKLEAQLKLVGTKKRELELSVNGITASAAAANPNGNGDTANGTAASAEPSSNSSAAASASGSAVVSEPAKKKSKK